MACLTHSLSRNNCNDVYQGVSWVVSGRDRKKIKVVKSPGEKKREVSELCLQEITNHSRSRLKLGLKKEVNNIIMIQ